MGHMDALASLESCGLSGQVSRKSSVVAPRGMVMAMSSAGGMRVEPGATVMITVSDGPPSADALMAGGAGEYRDGTGLAVAVPVGWQAAPFSVRQDDGTTVTGVTLSNVPVPAPVVRPGAPVQIKGQDLAAHGIALTITVGTGTVPAAGPVVVPPLGYPQGWLTSSAFPGTPYMRTSWFRIGGTTFAAAVKVGAHITGEDHAALVAVIRSIRAADTPQP
jgi:hypothetical protein